MTGLPYELWCLIAQYLPFETLFRFRHLNSSLFNLAMDQFYHSARIYHLKDEETKRMLNLSAVHGKRIRELELRPHLLGSITNVTRNSNPWRILGRTRSRPSDFELGQTLLRNISMMKYVEALSIKCCGCDDFPSFKKAILFVERGWVTFSQNIRSLTINCPVEALPSLLDSSLHLPRLQTFRVSLRSYYLTTAREEMFAETLAPFIVKHRGTLTCLQIGMIGSDLVPYTLDLFYASLGHLEFLEEFHFYLPLMRQVFEQPNEPLMAFLSRHRKQLRCLSVDFKPYQHTRTPRVDLFFSHPLFFMQFPALRQLTIRLPTAITSMPYEPYLVDFLSPRTAQLTKLSIDQIPITFSMLQSILAHEERSICHLEVHLPHLTSQFFDFLAKKLPNLHTLQLRFSTITVTELLAQQPNQSAWDHGMSQVLHFQVEMHSRRYTEWPLQQLFVEAGYCFGHWETVKLALACAIPSLVALNGLPTAEFPKPQN